MNVIKLLAFSVLFFFLLCCGTPPKKNIPIPISVELLDYLNSKLGNEAGIFLSGAKTDFVVRRQGESIHVFVTSKKFIFLSDVQQEAFQFSVSRHGVTVGPAICSVKKVRGILSALRCDDPVYPLIAPDKLVEELKDELTHSEQRGILLPSGREI
ncbi:hypothetical protein A3B18_00080 [Candidatus Giovannonibacteria bacterium RIFCSPLOWO2_01_FULL_46_13]|uniref:Uncharacterized protein n=1 Tax=Candidatus Giovannonibacteria bacterium RIFCSPLOWO2_01_FULL_46_13 TaxID=1798352 RepID=A0A1F5X362_9BACT|nr:MAG: hypothetical protein A3B18_00080 [Candidatus Giovannonibacteria bacterium RIFCSPLOWO2_01_FULL_46_13]